MTPQQTERIERDGEEMYPDRDYLEGNSNVPKAVWIEGATHERELMEKELTEKDKRIEELEIELQRMADECLDNDDPIHSDNDEFSV